jgi:hypothetical protein
MTDTLRSRFGKEHVLPGAGSVVTACWVALTILLGGCGSIPDLKPFADATADIQTGVTSLGVDYGASIPGDSKCGPSTCRDRFAQEWKPRVEVVAAIANYSDSLAQIADAGKSSAETAGRVMTSVGGLLDAVKVPLAAPAAKIVERFISEGIKYKALKSLDEAVDAAHPLIAEVIVLLDKDLAVLADEVDVIKFGAESAVRLKDEDGTRSQLAFARKSLAAHRQAMQTDHQSLAGLAKKMAGGQCSECGKEAQAIDQRLGEARTRLVAMERDVQSLEKSNAPLQAELDAVGARAIKTRTAIGKLRTGLQEWVTVHKGLGDNVRRSLRPNVRALVTTASDIRKLVEELRAIP